MSKRIASAITSMMLLFTLFMLTSDVVQVGSTDGYVDVDVSEAKQMTESNSHLAILDIRTVEEYNEGHIANAVLIPESKLESRPEELDPDNDIRVYCPPARAIEGKLRLE